MNTVKIILTLTNEGVKKFKIVPTFKNLLYTSQIDTLIVGANILTVNHSVWANLQRVTLYDCNNMNVSKY
jgi:hypothetical protein